MAREPAVGVHEHVEPDQTHVRLRRLGDAKLRERARLQRLEVRRRQCRAAIRLELGETARRVIDLELRIEHERRRARQRDPRRTTEQIAFEIRTQIVPRRFGRRGRVSRERRGLRRIPARSTERILRVAPAHLAARSGSRRTEHRRRVVERRPDARRFLRIDRIDAQQLLETERRIASIAFRRVAEAFDAGRLVGRAHDVAEIEIVPVRNDVLAAERKTRRPIQHLDDVRKLEGTLQHEIGFGHGHVTEDRRAQPARLCARARHLTRERRRIDDEQIRVRLVVPFPGMAELAFGPAHEQPKMRRLLVGDAHHCDSLPGNALVETHFRRPPDAARKRSATAVPPANATHRSAYFQSARSGTANRAPIARHGQPAADAPCASILVPFRKAAQARRARFGFSIVPMQRGAPQRQAQSCLSFGVMRSPTSMP